MTKTPRRKVLRDFQILEISAVTKPAQAPAIVAITKAASGSSESGKDMLCKKALRDGLTNHLAKMYIDPVAGPVSFATVVSESLRESTFYEELKEFYPYLHALETSVRSIVGDSSIDTDQRYTMIRNQVEGFMDVLKDKWLNMNEALALYADFEKEVIVTDKFTKNTDQAKMTDLIAKLEAAEASLKVLQAEAELSNEERDLYKSLDEKGKAAFLAKSATDRKADLAKTANDETVVIEGRTVRKSVIGEDTFAILKAQSDRIEKAESLAKKERERRELTEFSKAAEESYSTLPGTSVEKAKALQELSKCSAETQETIEKMLKVGAASSADAFKDLGHDSKTEKKADGGSAFLAKVDEIATTQKLNKVDAMAKARKQYPIEFEAYREAAA